MLDNIRQMSCVSEFAGVNTGDGFVGFYDRLFPERELDALYLIKGGAGCGKSTFMKRLIDAGVSEGYNAMGYLCGSDAGSLDGVVIESKGKRVGVIDATPPHWRELACPGASGDILDFGRFWDSAALRRRRSEIVQLTERKASLFDTAYKYFGAAKTVERHLYALEKETFLDAKATSAAKRFAERLSGKGCVCDVQRSGFTVNGKVDLGAPPEAEYIYPIIGDAVIASFYLERLRRESERRGIMAEVGRSPLDLSIVTSIYYPGDKVYVFTSETLPESYEKAINTKRFHDTNAAGEVRQKVRFAKKCRESLINGGIEALRGAGEYHRAIEKIYGECMDFDSLASEQAIWLAKIFSRLA